MKKLFIFLNIMLSFCVAWLIYTHVVYTPLPPDKELEMTPQGPSKQQTGIFDQGIIAMPGELSSIYENNIFLTTRGRVEKVDAKKVAPYKGVFELTGLFKISDVKGAIINSGGSRGRKALPSKFYRVNEPIGETGYTLEAISSKDATATLNNGRNKIILELDKDDKGSLRRRNDAVKTQKAIARRLNLSNKPLKVIKFSRTSTKKVVRKPTPKKKSAADVAAIRKKILERMKAKNKKR